MKVPFSFTEKLASTAFQSTFTAPRATASFAAAAFGFRPAKRRIVAIKISPPNSPREIVTSGVSSGTSPYVIRLPALLCALAAASASWKRSTSSSARIRFTSCGLRPAAISSNKVLISSRDLKLSKSK